jgi:hypothetical protein
MAKVNAYKVRSYDATKDDYVVSRRLATREGARKMRAELLENTEVEIDDSMLERGERFTPRDFVPQTRK